LVLVHVSVRVSYFCVDWGLLGTLGNAVNGGVGGFESPAMKYTYAFELPTSGTSADIAYTSFVEGLLFTARQRATD
jgi:hypothetical protein